jgi:hypothetical protein
MTWGRDLKYLRSALSYLAIPFLERQSQVVLICTPIAAK